jgi:CRP-like cAMP-binding protein
MEQLLFNYLSKYVTFSDEEQKAIIDLNIFKHYKKDTILLKEGQQSDLGYFVLKGCVRSYYLIDGGEKTTDFYTESESIRPICKIQNKPSEYFLTCVEDSILIEGDTQLEKLMFNKSPKFETLSRMLSEEHLAKKQFEFERYKISSPEQRFLNLSQDRPDLILRVPQHQLASYLGIKPQSLSRIRARLLKKKT